MHGLDLLHQQTEERLKVLDEEQRKNIYNFEVGGQNYQQVCCWLAKTCTRDVNLPLFGGIPRFFFTFRFLKNDFPLFLKNR